MDLSNYLKYYHEYVISSTIQESQLLSARHFRKKHTESMEQEWHQTKNDILKYFGCNTNSNSANNSGNMRMHHANRSRMDNSTHADDEDDANKHEDNPNDEIFEERLGNVIVDLAKYHRNKLPPIVDFDASHQWRQNIFAPISKIAMIHSEQQEEQQQQQRQEEQKLNRDKGFFSDFWSCLSSMIFESGINSEVECFLKENEYEQYYSNQNESLQQLLAIGARKYLERIYFSFIQHEIEKNKNFAKKGGKPGQRFIICAFVRLKYQNGSAIPREYKKVQIHNEVLPLWPLIYYSFRIGDIDSALYFSQFDESPSMVTIQKALHDLRNKQFEFSRLCAGQNDISSILGKLNDCDNLNALFDLEAEIWKELDLFYKRTVIKSRDPFEIGVYILLGKLFVAPPVAVGMNCVMDRQEDFLWFKLVTLYLNSQSKPQWINIDTVESTNSAWIPSLGLCELQKELKHDIGPNHYSHRILFVQSLILSQQFEAAIECLSAFNTFESIHVAICLSFYGLVSPDYTKNILSRTIHKYCNSKLKKKAANAHFIFYYLYTIHCEHQLIDFLCEPNTHLRQLVCGTISNECIDISNSLLYTFCGVQKYIEICRQSAAKARDNGEIEHCILLLILCGDFNCAARICIQLLCSHITDKQCNHSKQFILNLAKHLFTANKQMDQTMGTTNFHSLSQIDKSKIVTMNEDSTFNLICAIHFAEFYDAFYEGKMDDALNIININGVIPFAKNMNDINSTTDLRQYKHKTLKLHNDLQKYIGQICVSVMQILFNQFQSARNNKQVQNATNIAKKTQIIYNFFNILESQIKPIGVHDGDAAKQISNLYFQTRMD
eukprot:77744_1